MWDFKMVRKRIDHWIDGDTGEFTDGTIFRLAGVRAPEKHQFGGPKAAKTAAGMSGRTGGHVNIDIVGKSYGRSVVEMWNKEGSINERMIKKGYKKKGR
jgi:micrococcal nuclease